jgi:hypothetical protein
MSKYPHIVNIVGISSIGVQKHSMRKTAQTKKNGLTLVVTWTSKIDNQGETLRIHDLKNNSNTSTLPNHA